mgnify:CR=1 FL=1
MKLPNLPLQFKVFLFILNIITRRYLVIPYRSKLFIGVKVRKISKCQNCESQHPLNVNSKRYYLTDNNSKHDYIYPAKYGFH